MALSESAATELENLKKEVRSFLLTFADGINASTFIKQFRSVCQELPYRKFGHRSAEGFLLSFTDVLHVRHVNGETRIVAIPNEKSDHIQALVTRQKNSKPKKRGFKNDRGYCGTASDTRYPVEVSNNPPTFYPPYPFYCQPNHGQPLQYHIQPHKNPQFCHSTRHLVHPSSAPPPLLWNAPVHLPHPLVQVKPISRPPPGFNSPIHSNRPFFRGLNEIRRDSNQKSSPPPGSEQGNLRVLRERSVPQTDMPEKGSAVPSPEEDQTDEKLIKANGSCKAVQSSEGDNETDDALSDISTRNQRKSSLAEISDRMIQNFQELLTDHPDGIQSSKLASLYLEKFKVYLDYADHGFSSVREMVLHLPNVFVFEKSKTAEDWTLFDARISPKKKIVKGKWVPREIVDSLSELTQEHPQGILADEIIDKLKARYKIPLEVESLGFKDTLSFLNNCKSVTVQEENGRPIVLPKTWGRTTRDSLPPQAPALPPEDEMAPLWSTFFKENECGPFFQYKRPSVPAEKMLKVFVCDAYSPDLLWLHDALRVTALRDMMDELNVYYDENEDDLTFHDVVVKPNFACVVKFSMDLTWHRAEILQILPGDEVTVNFVDYGTKGKADIKGIRKLVKKFASDPIYAYTCKMAGIEPIRDDWPDETSNFLYELKNRPLFAVFVGPTQSDHDPLLINLVDTTATPQVCMSDILISKGLARAIKPPELGRFDLKTLQPTMMLLPYWMTESGSLRKHPLFTAKNLISAADEDYEERVIDPSIDPCCNEHDVLSFFQSNPISTVRLWDAVLTKHRDVLTNDFLRMAHELSGIDWKERKYVHGVRCPTRERFYRQAVDAAMAVRNGELSQTETPQFEKDVGRSISPDITTGEVLSPDGNVTAHLPLASSTLTSATSLQPYHSPTVHESAPARQSFREDEFEVFNVPTSSTSQFRAADSSVDTLILGSGPVSPFIPNSQANSATQSRLIKVPSCPNSPNLPSAAFPLQNSVSTAPTSHVPLNPPLDGINCPDIDIPPSPPHPSIEHKSACQIPSATSSLRELSLITDSEPHSAPTLHSSLSKINGNHHHPFQNVPRLTSKRTESVVSQSRRCACTVSVQIVDLADQIVHVVQHGENLLFYLDEISKVYAGNLSEDVRRDRIVSGQKYFKFAVIVVQSVDHPKLFEEMNRVGLIDDKKSIILVSVRDVGNVFRSLLPNDALLADLADEKFRL